MKALVTGASGLIGTALMERLVAEGNAVVAQSRNAHEDSKHIKWIQHDFCKDPLENLPIAGIDVVYHLAGQTSVYHARQDPLADLSANVTGFLKLLDSCRKHTPPPFIVFVGTATEAGITDHLPVSEKSPDRPITFYDISKLTAERYLHQYIREGWLEGCSLRLANVFGRSGPSQQKDRGVIDKIFHQALAGQNIAIYGTGEYVRDYIFIDDVISALMLAPKMKPRTNGSNFYIGSGQGISLKNAFLKVAQLVRGLTGIAVEIECIPRPAGLSDIDFRDAVIDYSAYRLATGWTPNFDFDSGLNAAYIAYEKKVEQ